ncbi:MAG: cytidine deaminase [Candidatus Kapabacteria bacterium]|nr:cytidine deaminase [Candidatus Kapabacteria bacterium]
MEKIDHLSLDKSQTELIEAAISLRKMAYCPYSNFKVGAALRDDAGDIHNGCNIESSDYTLTTHAEMLAIDSMVKSRVGAKIQSLAVALSSKSGYPLPCGLCRQKIAEFSDGDVIVYGVNLDELGLVSDIFKTSLNELYPFSFNAINLE